MPLKTRVRFSGSARYRGMSRRSCPALPVNHGVRLVFHIYFSDRLPWANSGRSRNINAAEKRTQLHQEYVL
jgi:hypothetical protein